MSLLTELVAHVARLEQALRLVVRVLHYSEAMPASLERELQVLLAPSPAGEEDDDDDEEEEMDE